MKNRITILVDNDSWIIPYAIKLGEMLEKQGYKVQHASSGNEIEEGCINFILGCTQLLDTPTLQRNRHNLVVHESDLPKGRGFSPMTWQLLEGKSEIPICLFEATEKFDHGEIWLHDTIILRGDELSDDWRKLQGQKTVDLCLQFVAKYNDLKPKKQSGTGTEYRRRSPKDSELALHQTIDEQFNLLRVVDNTNYPAFFIKNGTKYILKIFKV